MPAAPIPPPFERLEGRCFAFHPPIRKIDSNEWTYRKATWSEILVRNMATGRDLSIPRRFLGEAIGTDRAVCIVGLREQLEWQGGTVMPAHPRVIEMPRRAWEGASPRRPRQEPAPVIGIRLEPRKESRASRLAGGAVALGVMGCLALVGYSLEGGEAHRRAMVTSLDHTYLVLGASDNFSRVVQTLGVPDADRWTLTPAGDRLHVLSYSDRGFRAVLLAAGDSEQYIGSVNLRGRILQAVLLPDGSASNGLLHGLDEY